MQTLKIGPNSIARECWDCPQEIASGPLNRGAPVHYIYVDEAGTSAPEKISVVVGILVDADRAYLPAEAALTKTIEAVPELLRDGFVSHAKKHFGDKALDPIWPFKRRLGFFKDMASIPRRLGLPVSVAYVLRSSPGDPKGAISLADFHHMQAFGMCIGQADNFMRIRCRENEVATVVAEDVHSKRILARAAKSMRTMELPLPKRYEDLSGGRAHQDFRSRPTFKIARVRDSIHFAAKEDSPFLQIADAYAFAFRRFINNYSYGDELYLSLTGKPPLDADRLGDDKGLHSGCVMFYSPENYPPRTTSASPARSSP